MNRNNNETDSRTLDSYRKEIDSIDSQLVSLLSKRQDAAAAIGKIKRGLGIDIFDPAREEKVLKRLSAMCSENLSIEVITHVFNEIMSAARSVQYPFNVAFLGPEATFTHQAAISYFGHSVSFQAAETVEEVFGLVEKGICQQGVVPIENSYEGSVNSTLDQLYGYELKIVAEILLRIRHHLFGMSNSKEEIKQLYSHPMAIAQCRAWLKRNIPKTVSIKEVQSTSLAAKMAADENAAAAIGSRLSALTYGLNILEENIEDHPDNVTRFLVIGKTEPKRTDNDKTSILFFLNHRPGALHKALEALAKKDINMSRIESRPIKIRNWEYLFFVDLDGHEQDKNVDEAIREMERTCPFLKRLGSYPAATDPWE